MRYLESSLKGKSPFLQVSHLAHYMLSVWTSGDGEGGRVEDTEPGGLGGLLQGAGVPGREAVHRLGVWGAAWGWGQVLCRHGSQQRLFPNKQLNKQEYQKTK